MKRRPLVGTVLALVASFALVSTVLAASFTNGSFENTDGTYAGVSLGFEPNATNIPGWTTGATGTVDWIYNYWPAEQGSYSLDLNGSNNSTGTYAGSVSQTFDTVAGQEYFVSFWMSGNPYPNGPTTKTMTVQATGGAVQSYSYDILANGTTLTDMHWVDMGYTFTASGSSTTLTFASTTAGTSYAGPALDNVTVTAIATTGASCKNGGWETNTYLDANNNPITFSNQGQCVSYFATSGAVPIGN